MIVAGPGTGKTGTLAARVAYLLASRVARPGEMLALTFTAKAAGEMRERVARLVEGFGTEHGRVRLPEVMTFHALAQRVLAGVGQPRRLVREDERMALIRALVKPKALHDLSARELALRLSRYKNSLALIDGQGDDGLAELAAAYGQALDKCGAHDFDDLLTEWHRILARVEAESPVYRYVLVDEFQDTSEIQYALAKLLQPDGNLFVIGDPRQSIYGFRGAGIGMFDRFATDFPEHQAITLNTNYRSARGVVAFGNAVFPDAVALVPAAGREGRVRLLQTLNEYSEADWIVGEIEASLGGTDLLRAGEAGHSPAPEGERFNDFAIIYRTHRASQALQRRLAESGIPYQVAGEGSPYERPEIRCLVAALRYLATGGGDDGSVLLGQPALSGLAQTQQAALLEAWRDLVFQEATASGLATTLATQLGFGQADGAARRDLAQFIGTLVRFGPTSQGLAAAVGHLDDMAQSQFYDPQADAVALLTIHAAKGLEFRHVFALGVEEGLLPHYRPGVQADIDEEQRLFYVVATRAKDRLDLTYTKTRGGQPATLSRFVSGFALPELERLVDPAMPALERKRERRRIERSQGTLF